MSVIPKFYPIIQALFAMRLAEFIVLLCLLSLSFVGSDAVVRMTMLTATNGAKERKSSNETLEEVNRCNSKRLHFRSEKLSNSEKYNDINTAEDNKRVVPTGPNPLHNRKKY